MNEERIKAALKKFIREYKATFDSMGKRQSQLFELAALIMATEHYKRKGYNVFSKGIIGNKFKVKLNARGDSRKFSFFEVRKDNISLEIHANIAVRSFYGKDNGIYVIDVGVIKSRCMPDIQKEKNWRALDNEDLVTFIEAKKIVIYPMLLAQFVGIVHEIKPCFLGLNLPYDFKQQSHFFPALVSIGYLHGTSANIKTGFETRGFKLNIIPAFDIEIAKLRGRRFLQESPLEG